MTMDDYLESLRRKYYELPAGVYSLPKEWIIENNIDIAFSFSNNKLLNKDQLLLLLEE